MRIKVISGVMGFAIGAVLILGLRFEAYHSGYNAGRLAAQTNPAVPHFVKNGDVYQTLCPDPEHNWAIPAVTPLPPLSNDEYATSPIAFKCVPQFADFLTRMVYVPGTDKSYVEQYCPTGYGPTPFLGSGGGGGSDLMCGRIEWLQALDEQQKRRMDEEFKDIQRDIQKEK